MTFTTAHLSISLDGFVAGPDQSRRGPDRARRMALHQWHLEADRPGHDVDARWTARLLRPRGAYVMGRNMFGPVRGPWSSYDGDWRGWWGEEPPYHAPVFVLTHQEREPVEMAGARRSTSSPAASRRRWRWRARPATGTWTSPAGRRPSGRR